MRQLYQTQPEPKKVKSRPLKFRPISVRPIKWGLSRVCVIALGEVESGRGREDCTAFPPYESRELSGAGRKQQQ